MAFISFLFSSCGSYVSGPEIREPEESSQAFVDSFEIALTEYDSLFYEEAPRSMSLYYYEEPKEEIPITIVDEEIEEPAKDLLVEYTEEGRVPPELTAWGEAWNHRSLILRMDDILSSYGVEEEHVRVRMIAHAIVASGWKQNVWNYNAWGVRVGSWDGPWFIKSTLEMDDDGNYYTVFNAAWRSFSNWEESVQDYFSRISPNAKRDFYKEAHKWLVDPDKWADLTFWNALRKGKYFTDRHFTNRRFFSLCKHIRKELSETS